MRGIPRVPWEAEGIFDGISEYKLDKDGKIYEHKVTNVQMRDPPLARSLTSIGLNMIPVPRLQRAPQVWHLHPHLLCKQCQAYNCCMACTLSGHLYDTHGCTMLLWQALH